MFFPKKPDPDSPNVAHVGETYGADTFVLDRAMLVEEGAARAGVKTPAPVSDASRLTRDASKSVPAPSERRTPSSDTPGHDHAGKTGGAGENTPKDRTDRADQAPSEEARDALARLSERRRACRERLISGLERFGQAGSWSVFETDAASAPEGAGRCDTAGTAMALESTDALWMPRMSRASGRLLERDVIGVELCFAPAGYASRIEARCDPGTGLLRATARGALPDGATIATLGQAILSGLEKCDLGAWELRCRHGADLWENAQITEIALHPSGSDRRVVRMAGALRVVCEIADLFEIAQRHK